MAKASSHASTSSVIETKLASLMRSVQDGNAAAVQGLLCGCIPIIASVARQRGLALDRVDDVVQETLLSVHHGRATYDPQRRFLPWLRAISERRVIDLRRQHKRCAGREVHDPVAYCSYVSGDLDATELYDRHEQRCALRKAVFGLPAGQRQAVERLALNEQSSDEAAAATGRNKGALKVSLHRAITTLRVRMQLEPGCVECNSNRLGSRS